MTRNNSAVTNDPMSDFFQRSCLAGFNRRDFLKVAAAASALPVRALAQSGHDLAIVNGRVMTMDTSRPEAEAVLVRNGHIAVVGSNEDVEREAPGIARFDAGQCRSSSPATSITFAAARSSRQPPWFALSWSRSITWHWSRGCDRRP